MSRSVLYILGTLVVVAALAYAAFLIGVPPVWIGIGALAVIGLGLIGAASRPPTHTTTTDPGLGRGYTEVHHHR